jgi:cation transport regulator ChaB
MLTDDGRRVRAQLEPHLQDLANQAMAVTASAQRLKTAARQGAQTAHDVASRSAARKA